MRQLKVYQNLLIPSKIKKTPWWNSDCEKAIKKYKKALKKFKKSNTDENKTEFHKLKAIAKNTIKISKINSWIDYLQSINNQITIKEIWQKIKAIDVRNYLSTYTLKEKDEIISDPTIIANTLAQNFADNSSDKNYNAEFLKYKQETEKQYDADFGTIEENKDDPLNTKITYQELLEAIENSSNTSPGPDTIPNIFLKKLPKKAYNTILEIFNIIWTEKVFPDIWRQAIVVPIPKPGKPKFDKGSYRPISLTCCLCKIFEKIINKRLRWYLENNNIITDSQSGFRQNCSTTDCLVSLETNILDAFDKKQSMLTVCLDLEKAYDLVWRKRLLNILLKHNITGNMWHFIKNFLTDRKIKVRINDTFSEEYDIVNGVPQGSVISVTLFLLAINEIQSFITKPVHCTMFADDVTIFIKGKNIQTNQEIIQQTLNQLVKFANTSGFKFSKSKTVAIVFSKNKSSEENVSLTMEKENIKLVKEVKILGLFFDEKLTWKTHIEYLRKECFLRMNILKTLSSKNWGSSQEIICNTYKAIIQSKIDYGCIAYGSAKKNVIKKLDPILNSSMKIATGAFVTSPTISILSESQMLPLDLRRKKLALNYAVKVLNTPKNQVFNLLNQFLNKQSSCHQESTLHFPKRIQTYLQEYDIEKPTTILHKSIDCYWTNNNNNNRQNILYDPNATVKHVKTLYPDYFHIHTSINIEQNFIGAAALLKNGEKILLKLPHYYSYESSSLILVSKIIDSFQNTNQQIVIHINSSKLIKKIKTDILQDLILNEIIRKIDEANGRIILCNTHLDINSLDQLNEAIELARSLTFNEQQNSAKKEDLLKLIRCKLKCAWNQQWTDNPKKSHLHKIKSTVFETNPAKKFNRRDQVMLTRLRIGHTRITHQHILTKDVQQKCEHCNIPISIPHILLDCPEFEKERIENKIGKRLEDILNDESQCKAVIKFFDSLKIRHYV